MPLLINGEKVSSERVESIVKDFVPKGKDKTVTFVLRNFKPAERITRKGERVMSPGSGGIETFMLRGQTGNDGIYQPLHYYAIATTREVAGHVVTDFKPTHIEFRAGAMIMDASKSKELMAFMLLDNRNESKAEGAGRMPVYRMVDPSERSTKKVSVTALKIEALTAVAKFFENRHANGAPTKKSAIAAIYGGLQMKNFTELWSSGSYEEIQANLYDACEMRPKVVLDKLKDSNTGTEASIMNALELNVINYKTAEQTFYWTKNGKKIFVLPAGVNDDEANERFATWLNKTDTTKTLIEINNQIEAKEVDMGASSILLKGTT